MKQKIEKIDIIIGILIGLLLTVEVCGSRYMILFVPIFIIIYIINAKNNMKKNRIYGMTLWLIIIMFLTLVNGLRLPDNEKYFSVLYNTTTFSCVILTQLVLFQTEKNIKQILMVASFVATVVSGGVILAKEMSMLIYRWSDFIAGHSGYRLGVSSGINPNSITWLFGLMALFTSYFAITEKKIRYWGIYIIQIIIIFFTGSKNGLILATLPLLIYGIKAMRKFDIKVLILLIMLAVLFFIAIHKSPVLYTLIGRRIDSMIYTLGFTNSSMLKKVGTDTASTEIRIGMIKKASEMYWFRPILGYGIGWFAQKSGFHAYCHNNYLELLVSSGIVGFCIYYIFILWQFVKILKMNKSNFKNLAIILGLTIIILDLSTVNFYSNYIFYFRTIIMTILIKYYKHGYVELE